MPDSFIFCKAAFTVAQMRRMRGIADFLGLQRGATLNRSNSDDVIEINPQAIEKVIEISCNTLWQFSKDLKKGKSLGIVDLSMKESFNAASRPATYKTSDITSYVSFDEIDDLWHFPIRKDEESFDFPVTVKSREEYNHAQELKDQIKKSVKIRTDQEFFLTAVGLLDLIVDRSFNGVVFVRKNGFFSRQCTPVRFDFIPS